MVASRAGARRRRDTGRLPAAEVDGHARTPFAGIAPGLDENALPAVPFVDSLKQRSDGDRVISVPAAP